jgi:excisionase family DNA binding protein
MPGQLGVCTLDNVFVYAVVMDNNKHTPKQRRKNGAYDETLPPIMERKPVRPGLPVMLLTSEAAELLHVNYSTVRRWLTSGQLPYIKPFDKVLIRRADVLHLMGLEDPS